MKRGLKDLSLEMPAINIKQPLDEKRIESVLYVLLDKWSYTSVAR